MRYCLIGIIAVCLSGCLMEAITVTAIQGELAAENAQAANRVRGQAKDMKSKIELESAVNSYAGYNGKYPATLNVLVPDYLPEIPIQYNGLTFAYNPGNGKVTLQHLGVGGSGNRKSVSFTQADVNNLSRLRKSIGNYRQMTGYNPESLQSLAPMYITSVPSMSSGGAYRYNQQTGVVSHPGEFRQQQQQVGRPPGGQTPGGQIGSITGAHNERQQKALDDLGF